MRKARHKVFVEKSIDACLAAIEVYNKPDFRYREESFAILMLNAWELLLKARILKENKNDMRFIEVREPRRKKDGSMSSLKYAKKNRSGNVMTIGVQKAAELVRNYPTDNIDMACVENIYMLMEIRDNSVHFHNVGVGLSKRMQEVGSASLRNSMRALEKWFDYDLSRYNFYLMPVAFHSAGTVAESLLAERHNVQTQNLLDYFYRIEKAHPSDANRDFNVTLRVEMRFVRSTGGDAIPVKVSKDPDAIKVQLSEEDIRKRYPWDYSTLVERLKSRYSDFRQNNSFYALKSEIEKSEQLCKVRYLDPKNQKSSKKHFYNPNIVSEFDKHYNK